MKFPSFALHATLNQQVIYDNYHNPRLLLQACHEVAGVMRDHETVIDLLQQMTCGDQEKMLFAGYDRLTGIKWENVIASYSSISYHLIYRYAKSLSHPTDGLVVMFNYSRLGHLNGNILVRCEVWHQLRIATYFFDDLECNLSFDYENLLAHAGKNPRPTVSSLAF